MTAKIFTDATKARAFATEHGLATVREVAFWEVGYHAFAREADAIEYARARRTTAHAITGWAAL